MRSPRPCVTCLSDSMTTLAVKLGPRRKTRGALDRAITDRRRPASRIARVRIRSAQPAVGGLRSVARRVQLLQGSGNTKQQVARPFKAALRSFLLRSHWIGG